MKKIGLFLTCVMFVSLFMGVISTSSAIKVLVEKNSLLENSSGIITVDNEGDGDFTNIKDAVNAAKTGDIIEVYSGIYYENVIVDKQLTLKGITKELGTGDDAGKPIIDSEGFGSLDSSNCSIRLKADRCVVENFTLINSGAFRGAGIKIYSNYNVIQNNIISNNWYGIYPLEESSFNFFYNNEIKNNDVFGIKCGGLFDDNCSDNNISNNKIHNNRAGVAVAPRDIVYNNTIFGNSDGIILESENAKVIKNTIYENENGIFVHESNLIVKNNNISNNNVGVNIFYLSKGSLTIYNNLTKNDIGVIAQDCKYCSINYNNFFNNTVQAIFVYLQKPKITNWNRNYWSDWKTTNRRPIEGKVVIDRWPGTHEEYSLTQYDKSPSKDPINGTKAKIKIINIPLFLQRFFQRFPFMVKILNQILI